VRLTVAFMTGRADPKLDWVVNDLSWQKKPGDELSLIVVDVFDGQRPAKGCELAAPASVFAGGVRFTAPKPNIWQGAHRVTKRDWWATANARNTAIALCQTDYIAFLDDRSKLGPRWLETVRAGYRSRASVICGSYDKLEGPQGARITSRDHRRKASPHGTINCGGAWLYGCTFALPLSWALDVNGFEEGCDGLTGEDYIFGMMLANRGHRIDFLPDMFVLQDRAPGNESCKGSYACMDKGKSPKDKSHAALDRFGKRKRTEFTPDLMQIRATLAAGGAWPIPTDRDARDWYDGQLIREMEPQP
jgi:hypothetical protein